MNRLYCEKPPDLDSLAAFRITECYLFKYVRNATMSVNVAIAKDSASYNVMGITPSLQAGSAANFIGCREGIIAEERGAWQENFFQIKKFPGLPLTCHS